jgi:hypothetical protein
MSKPERDGGKAPPQFFPPLLASLVRRHALKQSELRDPLLPKEQRWRTTMSQWRRSRRIFDPNRVANKPKSLGSLRYISARHPKNLLKLRARQWLDR